MKTTGLASSCLAVLLLASCMTTTPPDPVRKTSDDCLVLIRTVSVNASDTISVAREYRFELSEAYPALTASKDPESFMYVMLREPGARIIGMKSLVNGYNVTGQSFEEPLDIELPYKPGEVVVADFTFVQSQKRGGPNQIVSDFDFQKTSEDSKTAVLAQFHALEWSASWR